MGYFIFMIVKTTNIIMNKKNKIIIITIIAIGLLIYRFGFILIFWLTATPRDGELRLAEKVLFEEIKKELNAKEIDRSPRHHISNPRDTTSYEIIISEIACRKLQDSLSIIAKSIVIKANKRLKLNPKFYKYKIIFYCDDFTSQEFLFRRDNLPN
jgi:hypothetical protein